MEQKKNIKKRRGKVRLVEGKCIACGARCESSCPVSVIEMNAAGEPFVFVEKCIGCAKCVKVCAAGALEMFYTPEELELLKQWATQHGSVEEDDDQGEKRLREMLARYRG